MKKFAFVVITALVVAGAWRFSKQAQAHELAGKEAGPPPVRVVKPVAAAKVMQVNLPGTVRAKDQVTLYARTNGFLRTVLVDLGDAVKKDQVLARLDAPDLVASLSQANARLAQANASLTLITGQHERTLTLGKSGNLSAQDIDASALRLEAARSEKALATAEVQRLEALVSYLTVRAPFDGTINRRFVDDGALVSAERTALFDVATTASLQIDVDVPQWAANQVKTGMAAKVVVNGATLDAKVSRAAAGLDPVLRTLHTELIPESAMTSLVPGAYARVTFEVPRDEAVIQIPSSAIAVRNGNPTVALVGAGEMLHYVPVKLVRELGRDVEVLGDVPSEARVALYPPASLADGDVVSAVNPK
ncbi:MAG: efflux RND transporter periplasmic adaptor subunit [Archangium sp.]